MKLNRILRRGDASSEPAPAGASLARGRREWADRYAGLASGKRNWQLAALTSCGRTHSWPHPPRARVACRPSRGRSLGQAVAFGPAEQLRKTDERLIRYQLNLFIRDVRSVFSDSEVQKTVINSAYGHAKDSALGFLNDYFKKSNPFLREAEGTITVQVQSVLRLSASSWQVQWRETQIATSGRVVSETAWQAILGVELTPETTDVLLVNPLGLYVTEINWTQTL
jgi:type IV secretion system protein VirB5